MIPLPIVLLNNFASGDEILSVNGRGVQVGDSTQLSTPIKMLL